MVVLSCVALFGYFAAQLFDEIAHGVLGGAWKEQRRHRTIMELRDHIIVCGYGRVGRRAAEEFRGSRVIGDLDVAKQTGASIVATRCPRRAT